MMRSRETLDDAWNPPLRAPWLAATAGLLAAVVASTTVGAVCAFALRGDWPAPGSPAGLGLGTAGFVLMVGAQTLYTLRKRLPAFTRGRMSTWLQAHIFMGLFGAFLVAVHAGGRLQGVAGAAFATLAILIVSGLVGRYLYTAAPRTLDGIEVDARQLLERCAAAERELERCDIRLDAADLARLGVRADLPGWLAVLGRPMLSWLQRRRCGRFVGAMKELAPEVGVEVQRMLCDRYQLQLDIRSVAAARHWLSWWHMLHVPLSWAMFTLAAVHVAGALSYVSW